jgi:predicted GH43/DUF377 family glycosyl hydrolase
MNSGEAFFEDEVFDWQHPVDEDDGWNRGWVYDPEKYWGGFPPESGVDVDRELPTWAVGPFEKHTGNPIVAPSPGSWDRGRFGGGVHNGSIVRHDGAFWYVYRGERECDPIGGIDYICKIGLAKSHDGVSFTKVTTDEPLFGADDRFSYEDVSLVQHDGTFYLFCNRWDWEHRHDPARSGCWLATSDDLVRWKEHGIVYPDATMIHRNGVVLQDPQNRPVRVDGHYVMYINNYLIGRSTDLLTWESHQTPNRWPGGEGCFALTDYSDDDNAIILFTGGHHSGHFYAIGEVLLSKTDPEKPISWLPRPVLHADGSIPHESGYSASDSTRRVSPYRDCIFFNGLTAHDGAWWLYYGGSEYYTCLATCRTTTSIGGTSV